MMVYYTFFSLCAEPKYRPLDTEAGGGSEDSDVNMSETKPGGVTAAG